MSYHNTLAFVIFSLFLFDLFELLPTGTSPDKSSINVQSDSHILEFFKLHTIKENKVSRQPFISHLEILKT